MSKSSTINGNWIVTEAEGIHVSDGQMRLEIFDGSVFGQAPCNSFNAQLMSSDGGFNLGPLDVRGNICDEAAMNDEQTYLRMLNRLSHFEIDADGALILSSFGAPMIKAVREEN